MARRRGLAEILASLVEELRPSARILGCEDELLANCRLVIDGGGASRQRRVAKRVGLEGLIRHLASETTRTPAKAPQYADALQAATAA